MLTTSNQSTRAASLLIMDDEPVILQAIESAFRTDGYHILTAQSGEQALNLLISNQVGVIIADQRMPGMGGIEFLNKSRSLCPDAIRIVLSGYAPTKSTIDFINRGDIHKHLAKAWDDRLLHDAVREAFQRHQIISENRGLEHDLRVANRAIAQLRQGGKG